MNFGYIFDLDNIINEEVLRIQYLSGLHYKHYDISDFKLANVISFRDEVMRNSSSNIIIDKLETHIFYVVIKNDKETLKQVSSCLSDMQRDKVHFNQEHYEVHVMLNMIDEDGVSIKEYEKLMPCLKDNAICVYTWLLDKYDYGAGVPIISSRRSHAIARLADIICNHRRKLSLRQMTDERNPIYTLFGNSSVFLNEEERERAIRYYYYYKHLQHLLNIADNELDTYLRQYIIPFQDNKTEMAKRLDSSSSIFLHNHRVPIEATYITEKTQDLLLKSSNDDEDYLINVTDNHIVFIDDLSRKQQWQINDTETFVKECWERISNEREHQEIITDDFIDGLHERATRHKRTVFDKINNEVSQNREKHIKDFKEKIDKYLLDFLNRNDSHNYTEISEVLTPLDVKKHHSNIDCGIAFLGYLESGNVDYLTDLEVSAGDINLLKIQDAISHEETRCRRELNEKERDINEYYKEGVDGKSSTAKSEFTTIDTEIKKHAEEIRRLTFQLNNWIDEDSSRKLTAKSRAMISIACGALISGLWALIYFFGLSLFWNFTNPAILIAIIIFLSGLITGICILLNVEMKRREAEERLSNAKDKKIGLIRKCMDGIKDLVEKRYRHMLAFHGLKTINELLEYVKKKEDDLSTFRKTLFNKLVDYRLSSLAQAKHSKEDFNTIELNDNEASRLLFGTNPIKKIPFCFSCTDGITLADTFDDYNKKKVRFNTTRFSLNYKQQEEFDAAAIDNEVISCKEEHASENIQYTTLERKSVLPEKNEVNIEDVNQGQCGDCYFMATLASIAQMNPEYIIGERGMIEPLGTDNRYFRVKFYDKDGNRVNFDVDNRFWNRGGRPIYAGIGKSKDPDSDTYNPWVMAVEKAWAKANSGSYDNIEGASDDGKERVRMVEYSYAVTGKSAFYCKTKNVADRHKLQEMIRKHIIEDKLPITLYSADSSDMAFSNKDAYLVGYHAYSLKSVNEDGTFDIFNPWNNHAANEDVRGKHYEKVNIDFIKDNFDVIVFFGIKEADFTLFERELTGNTSEMELANKIEELMNNSLKKIDCKTSRLEDLMTDEVFAKLHAYSTYLCSETRLKDKRGVHTKDITYIEPAKGCENANSKLEKSLRGMGEKNITILDKRNDDKQSLTVLRISPPYALKNFNDTED